MEKIYCSHIFLELVITAQRVQMFHWHVQQEPIVEMKEMIKIQIVKTVHLVKYYIAVFVFLSHIHYIKDLIVNLDLPL